MDRNFLGVGIYTVPEAARLTGTSGESIRRWLWGYRYKSKDGETTAKEPLWSPQVPIVDDIKALGFRDLIEIQFVSHFLSHGISLQSIRKTIGKATELLEQSYPLSSVKFRSDGKRVLAEILGEHEQKLVFDLSTGQYLLSFLWDKLLSALEYSEYDELLRWWPMGKDRRVVIDPRRSFGRPISPEGVPTAILTSALRAEKSVESVAYWYNVDPDSVLDAREYERLLRAA